MAVDDQALRRELASLWKELPDWTGYDGAGLDAAFPHVATLARGEDLTHERCTTCNRSLTPHPDVFVEATRYLHICTGMGPLEGVQWVLCAGCHSKLRTYVRQRAYEHTYLNARHVPGYLYPAEARIADLLKISSGDVRYVDVHEPAPEPVEHAS